MHSIVRLKFKKNRLQLNIKGENIDKSASIVLKYRAKLEEDIVEYKFDIISVSDKLIKGSIDLSAAVLKVIYWDVVLKTDKGEFPVYVGKLKNMIRFPLYDGKYRDKITGMFMHPYITPDKTLAFQYREYTESDSLSFRVREIFIYLLYRLTKYIWDRKKIILVYEKFCMMAQDNAYYFFKYCMDNNMEEKMGVKIYYIINKNSPDIEKLSEYKNNLVYFMSLKHKLYLLGAKLYISTDTKKHIYAWRLRMSILEHVARHKPLVFLQHGVTALKRVDYIYGKGNIGDCNLFIVTSDYEKEIVRENFGYKNEEIAVTGFARWDVLNDKSENSRMILIMPTWRNWLEDVSDELFVQSEYYNQYRKLLESEKLTNMLEEKNIELCFYIHPKFRDYIKSFRADSTRIRIIPFGEEPLNEIMMKCKMLVTDYSSVCWDVFYQGKPVVFYQFDLPEYLEAHGSYMDMNKELFGESVPDADKLVDILEQYADNGFELKADYAGLREYYFKYIDDDNSKRICDSVLKLMER